MSKSREIVGSIREMMDAGDLAPTPATYGLCYDYLMRRDSDLVAAVDRAIAAEGALRASAVDKILAECRDRPVQIDDRLLGEAEEQIQTVLEIVEKGGEATGLFGDTLRASQEELGGGDIASDRQLIVKIARATSAMLETTREMQSRLVQSSETIAALREDLIRVGRESRTDTLVDLPNRKAFTHHIEEAIANARATGGTVSLGLCDIDHFKRLNDNWGHSFGDDILRLFAARLKDACGDVAFPARYGGEEFVVSFPNKTADEAYACLEKYRAFVEAAVVRKRGTQENVKFTFSAGIAELAREENAAALIDRADQALYRAKNSGRNRVCLAQKGDVSVMAVGRRRAG